MGLLDYTNFLLNEGFLFEGSSGDELKKLYSVFSNSLDSKTKEDLKNFAKTELGSELGPKFAGLFDGSTYITVYDTVIKIRSSQGGRLGEFSKDAKKKLDEIFSSLKDGKTPTNKFEKAVSLVVYLIDEYPDAIFWAPKDSLKKETLALESIRANLNSLKGPNESVRLIIQGELFNSSSKINEVILEDVEKVSGTPKADFLFEIVGNPPIYISHKDGKSAKDFQQYGGLDTLRDHPFVKEFFENIIKVVGNELKSGDEFAVIIPPKHIDLGIKAIFGSDAAPNNRNWSPDNIQLVMQGDISFVPAGEPFDNAYKLVPSGHVLYNPVLTGGNFSIKENDSYWPALYVSYRKDQGGSYGFKNARFGVWAQGNQGVIRGIEKWDNAVKEKLKS
jgi:hypothetical protein